MKNLPSLFLATLFLGSTLARADELPPAFGQSLDTTNTVDGQPEFRARPITVELLARLNSDNTYNVLVANDAKDSPEHWELFTLPDTGTFVAFLPGQGGVYDSHVKITDGNWHALAAIIGPTSIRLFVDGKMVLDTKTTPLAGSSSPGDLTFCGLADGTLRCDGSVDDVRISSGERKIDDHKQPLTKDAQTLGLWDFN